MKCLSCELRTFSILPQTAPLTDGLAIPVSTLGTWHPKPPTAGAWFLWPKGFPDGLDGKEPAWNAGDMGLIPGLGQSPGGGQDNPLQCSCPENPMDRGAWRAIVHGVAESDMTEWLTLSLQGCIIFHDMQLICMLTCASLSWLRVGCFCKG